MKLRLIAVLNSLALLLIVTWSLPSILLWTDIDDRIFFFFNQFVNSSNPLWTNILALLNNRMFDAVAFAVMALLFSSAVYLDPRPGKISRWLAIGVCMVLTAGVLALLTLRGIDYAHPSPTLFFDHAHRLTYIVTFPTKDSSSNSFPDDHGLMLMIFAAFMLRFADNRVAISSVAFVVLLSAPRIMAGAHWFSDIYMGSLSIALLFLPWVLLTPFAPKIVKLLSQSFTRIAKR